MNSVSSFDSPSSFPFVYAKATFKKVDASGEKETHVSWRLGQSR